MSSFITSDLGRPIIPEIDNEPMKNYAVGSTERKLLEKAITEMNQCGAHEIPLPYGNQQAKTEIGEQVDPSNKSFVLCKYEMASSDYVSQSIERALKARKAWAAMPFADRAAIFLKAADLLAHKYRYKLIAASMLGQGKNIWQAEIDAAAELCDFWRFNCLYAQEIYSQQPPKNSPGTWNRVEYRGLEGFILAVSPFNFTSIGGNLCSAPALMGNVVIWKPAPNAILSNYIIYQILLEAGLPQDVIQWVPGDAPMVVEKCIKHRDFVGLHFTGSTAVFKKIWKDIAQNLDIYRSYPRIVGETGGKNIHFVHSSAPVNHVVQNSIRAAFEFQGQKCSACSRIYVPDNLWPQLKSGLIEGVKKIKVGNTTDFTNFVTPVINQVAFDRIKKYIEFAKASPEAEIIAGGTCDDSIGFFVEPTVILTTNPQFKTMMEEIFGPVLTVYVYPADQYIQTLELADATSPYALTCALFAASREAIVIGSNKLRDTAGNFYINDKCTGAVVGQQPFGGARASGTNDKAGASMNLLRWVSARTTKESFLPLEDFAYPSNRI